MNTFSYRQNLIPLLEALPEAQLRELYHYALFIKERFSERETTHLPSVSAKRLRSLSGLVAVGGDAVKDTEALFNE